jgi:hypothetical protein
MSGGKRRRCQTSRRPTYRRIERCGGCPSNVGSRSGNGVRFREAMTGSLRVSGVSRAARLTLNAHITGWRNFIHEPNHPVSVSGTVDIEGFATGRPVTGTLELFSDPGDVAMRYRLQTQQDSGEAVVLIGTKHQHRNPLRLWSDLTTLHVEAADTVGVLRISPPGVLKLAQLDPWGRVHPHQTGRRRSTVS